MTKGSDEESNEPPQNLQRPLALHPSSEIETSPSPAHSPGYKYLNINMSICKQDQL